MRGLEIRLKSSKEIHEKFPKSTRIRIVINTDELYNSSKFLHGAVSYNCKSKYHMQTYYSNNKKDSKVKYWLLFN